jgi:acyl transferase domain-containing protein
MYSNGAKDNNAATLTGNGLSFLVGRISYSFGLQGPCISTDTACSSSLVALHLGRQGIATNQSLGSMSGGSNVMLIPLTTSRICILKALSPDGRCKTFDSTSDGYGRGEGIAIALLKKAMPGEDCMAFVASSFVNQDGKSSGLTAPNGPAQSNLITRAFDGMEDSMDHLATVSLHGTGTPLGDPIEVNALASALRKKSAGIVSLASSKVRVV